MRLRNGRWTVSAFVALARRNDLLAPQTSGMVAGESVAGATVADWATRAQRVNAPV
ncbi:hypothetical protein [Mesorhizobium sp. M0019]|uniref:hypothetical protein n=1 Tax=Mesorhizobium sp. M0019 TaxID=2956845 RepID=UPI0033351743